MPNSTVMFAALSLLVTTSLAAQQPRDFTPYLIPDRAAEVALARSAAPASVSDSATVLVLTRTGMVEAAHGTNGFTCLVLRSFSGALADSDFWSAKIRAPHCLNPPAVRTILPEMRQRAEWIMAGASREEIARRLQRAYASHQFPLPAVGAMAYMLSPQQYLADVNPHWVPHVMFYYDRSQSVATWGAGAEKGPIIDGSDAQSPVITLLVPVRQWSDGTPALPKGVHAD